MTKKDMGIKFNSQDGLLLRKTLNFCNMVIVVRSVFHEGNIFFFQIFLDECFHKL